MPNVERSEVRVAGCPVTLVGIYQDYVWADRYLTTLHVVGRIHSDSAYLPLADMPHDILNLQTAYMTDAELVGLSVTDGFVFKYELTVRDKLPYIL